ncbi:MAG: 4-hydroxythreonine-4-phosphate dehydrogenase PdxA [Burkholderiaceae bacterium]
MPQTPFPIVNNSDYNTVAVTLGDPTGIGPEIVVKALADPDRARHCIVVGDAGMLEVAARALGLPMPPRVAAIEPPAGEPFSPGAPSARSGEAAYRAVIEATDMVADGRVQAIATAPLAKAQMQAAGHPYPGHTELLAFRAGRCPVRMMLASPRLRVVLVTIHLPLREAIDQLGHDAIVQTLHIADAGLRRMGIAKPRFAVAGLNPHAGESGLFGREEIEIVAPAVEVARAAGIDVHGPHPPDTVFMRAMGNRWVDAVIALYHDQGLIPVKLDGLDQAVNVTLGLPYLRTSPDHGTAFDIAGQGVAEPASMIAAIDLAIGRQAISG